MRHPVVHYPLLLYTTSRNYDVVDLARQSNPNFFIVTPAPSRGRKLGKPTKQQKNRGEKSSKLKLYSSWWSSWKLMTSMVIVDQISRKVEGFFFEAAVEAVLRPRKQPMMTYIVFLWPKRTSLSSSTGFRVSRRIFFCLICQQNDAEKRGKSSTFTKKVFRSIWKLYLKIDFSPFLCFEV